MKIRQLAISCILAVVFAGALSAALVKSHADEPDPLALPCTIGATATKTNPITKHADKFLCEQCASETCWILQSDQK